MSMTQDATYGTLAGRRPPGLSGVVIVAAILVVVTIIVTGWHLLKGGAEAAVTAPPPPTVVVSAPLQKELDKKLGFLGQMSAIDNVEIRAQVGGTLTSIHFKDGELVKKGALLFSIESTPYDIKLSQARAAVAAAKARFVLAKREEKRAQMLQSTDAGSVQSVEQRRAEKDSAEAALDNARAMERDAQFDVEHCRILAPFAGRIGKHLVSVGSLIAGSRAATSPTTLLTTLVSLDPIYLDFEMSEADFRAFMSERNQQLALPADRVTVSPEGSTSYSVDGQLDFIDNAIDRSSGTFHARAILQNTDLRLTPGAFARVRLSVAKPAMVFLVPEASVLPNLSDHIVLTVGTDNVVTVKRVDVGEVRGGLRIIRAGLAADDRVIIGGLPIARPGSKVSPQDGTIEFLAE